MPYKSDSQRRFFHAAEERGDMPPSTVKEFDQASKGKELPEKIGVGLAHKHKKGMEKVKKLWKGGGC